MKRLLLYSSLLISLSLPQTLLSRGYARTKIIFSDHSSNRSRKAQLPPPSRSRSAHFNHKKYLEYYHATAKWYQRSLRNEKPATILNKYQFYEFPGFQELIKTFPTYKEHIFATHKQLSERPKIINWLAKWLVISSPAQAQEIIQKMHDELVKEEKKLKEEKKEQSRIDQLHDIYDSYINDPVEDTEQNKFLSNRVKALEQSGNNNFQSSLHYTHWTDISLDFIQQFKLDSIQPNLTGTSIQHAIQQEFHDITKSTQHLWKTSSNNVYIQEFVTRNVICIKKGIEQNQEGNIVEAMQFADIAWAILDHAQAVAEGIAQGTINVAYTFSHPVETAKNIGHAVSTIMSILHRSTLEVTDMCILSVTDKPAAQKKLKDWEQNFTQLINTAYKQYQETPNRDITKFASSFVTEVFLTGKTCHALKGFFSFARTKTAKLIQKAQNITESPVLATTSEGITAQVNKAVKQIQNKEKFDQIAKSSSQVQPLTKKISIEGAKKIWNESKEFERLSSIVKKSNKEVNKHLKSKYYDNMSSTEYLQHIEKAEKFYENIRLNTTDIIEISKNTGIPKEIIKKIKNHIFHEEHVCASGIKKFDACPYIADAWQRLNDGNFAQKDLLLLQHEYAESLLMKGVNLDYDTAHKVTNYFYNWDINI
ncbi:MAG: hypothetical protein WCD44_02865 [Candidatus Babeliales bacterium]